MLLHSIDHLMHGGAVQSELHWVILQALCHQGEEIRLSDQDGSFKLLELSLQLFRDGQFRRKDSTVPLWASSVIGREHIHSLLEAGRQCLLLCRWCWGGLGLIIISNLNLSKVKLMLDSFLTINIFKWIISYDPVTFY